MFVNAYDITLENATGETVAVSLRLTIGEQLKLKKRFNESTLSTLFNSIDDPERLIAVFDAALAWAGNKNAIKSGADLIDLMASNGLLGMSEKQHIITRLAQVSGIISETERDSLDKMASKLIDDMIAPDEKNA